MTLVVAYDLFLRVSHVDGRLEYLHLLPGKLRTAQTANQLFRLAREHGTADYLYSTRATGFSTHKLSHNGGKISKSF
jgi:hypothetical protein